MMLGEIDYHLLKPWFPDRGLYPAVSEFLASWARSEPERFTMFRIAAPENVRSANRRNFLKFLAASPALAWAQQTSSGPGAAIESPKDALNVHDFEELAWRRLPPAHWGYLSTGVDDDATRNANIAAFQHIQLRPRRLVDISQTDMRVDLFGATLSPIFLCPVSDQRMSIPMPRLLPPAQPGRKGRCRFWQPRLR